MNTKPIIYQISKYQEQEAFSVKENRDAKRQLRALGYVVFNPIEHSHYDEADRKHHHLCPNCKTKTLYVTLNMRKNLCQCSNCHKTFEDYQIIDQYPMPDYVAEDLRFIEGWLKQDYVGGDHDRCLLCRDECCGGCPYFHQDRIYDSGVVCVVLPSAYHYECETAITCRLEEGKATCGDCMGDLVWDSNGAKQEYEFAKAHHILCISLETALTIPFANWGDHAL